MPKLSMVLYSCGKTINLAKSGSYQVPRKPPLNTLIFEKLPEPRCTDRVTCGIKGPPITKPVRVCTKEDLQSFYCPPPPCDCKLKPQPLTFTQKLGWLFKQAMKALMVGAITYYTYKEGLWSDPFRSSCFIGKFIERCPPEEDDEASFNEFATLTATLEDPEACFPFIPHSGYILFKLQYYWNQIIITIFWLILDAPGEFIEALLNLFRKKPKPIVKSPCD